MTAVEAPSREAIRRTITPCFGEQGVAAKLQCRRLGWCARPGKDVCASLIGSADAALMNAKAAGRHSGGLAGGRGHHY